jgi:O-antigen ligase
LGILAVVWLARPLATGRLTARTGLEPPLALLAGLALLGLVVSADRSTSQAGLWRILLGIAWFYGLANLAPGTDTLRRLGWLWVITGAGLVLLVVFGTDWQNTRLLPLAVFDLIPRLGLNTRLGVLGNARGMGMALALVMPLLLALALLGRERALRLAALGVALLMVPALVLTQSLQGAIGLAAGVALVLVLWSPWTLLAAIPLAAVAIWAASRIDWPGLALSALDINNAAGIGVVLRIDIWSRALAMIGDMPLTGIGLESYPLIQTQFYPGFLLGPEPHAHNLLMQLTLDMGVAGMLGFLWLVAAFAVVTFDALRRKPEPGARALLAGAAAGVAAMLGAGLIDSFWGFKLSLLFWLLLGTGMLAARAVHHRRPDVPANTRTWPWHAAAALAIAVILTVLVVARPGTWHKNLGLVQAHQALVAVRRTGVVDAGQLAAARDRLLAVTRQTSANAQVYDELASLHAWLGEDEPALHALRQRVARDLADPMARYAPWEPWRRQLSRDTAHNPADDALRVYSQWMNRYPDRAEGYARIAIVWDRDKGDKAQAMAVLRSGLDRGAQPAGLLAAYLAALEPVP